MGGSPVTYRVFLWIIFRICRSILGPFRQGGNSPQFGKLEARALVAARVLFLDRGRAFFNTVTGRVTAELAAALEPTELELFWGDDAHEQPGYCADVLLHETAVAWIRKGLSTSVPRLPWKETRAQYSMRLRDVVAAINRRHNVAGLCNGLLGRLDTLKRCQGDRLKS